MLLEIENSRFHEAPKMDKNQKALTIVEHSNFPTGIDLMQKSGNSNFEVRKSWIVRFTNVVTGVTCFLNTHEKNVFKMTLCFVSE